MRRKIAYELFHNSVLILFFGICVLAFYLLRYQKNFQFVVITTVAVFYFLWGIGYHWARKNLTPAVFCEYFILALTVFIIGLFLLLLR